MPHGRTLRGTRGGRVMCQLLPGFLLATTILVSRMPAEARERMTVEDAVKRTVAALVGKWTFKGTLAEGSTRTPFEVTMTCRRAAFGLAVSCALAGRLPGVGPMEASALIGYNADDGHAYWMEISSTGEYHAHRGLWQGDTMQFEPLTFTARGASSTEMLSLRVPAPGTLVLKSTTTSGADTATIEATAMRQPTPR
jgi:hypothetical protein